LDLLSRGATRCGSQAVPGLGVDRISDVHHDLARQLIGVLADCVLDRRIVDGQEDDLAAEWRRRIKDIRRATEFLGELACIGGVAADDLDLVAAFDGASADSAAHVAGTYDRDLHRVNLLSLDPPSGLCSGVCRDGRSAL
jgi:hypothetical protein